MDTNLTPPTPQQDGDQKPIDQNSGAEGAPNTEQNITTPPENKTEDPKKLLDRFFGIFTILATILGTLAKIFHDSSHENFSAIFTILALFSGLTALAHIVHKAIGRGKIVVGATCLLGAVFIYVVWVCTRPVSDKPNLPSPIPTKGLVDDDQNPIGLLQPADDTLEEALNAPIPDRLLKNFPDIFKDPPPRPELNPNGNYLIFGGNIVGLTSFSQLPVVCYHGRPILEIESTPLGAFVSGTFYSKDGKLVAVLVTNKFTLNRLNYWKKQQDKNSLQVIDQEGIPVFSVRIARTNVIQFEGKFRFPDSTEAVVSKDGFQYQTGLPFFGNWVMGIGGFDIITNGRAALGVMPRHDY